MTQGADVRGVRQILLSWVSAFFLLLVWSFAMPLFSSPDEPANFIKASAVVRGEWVGESVPADLNVSYWMTVVDIDPRFANAHSVPTCFAFKSDEPACDRPLEDFGPAEGRPATNVGRYPPLAPAIAGLGTIFGPDDLSVRGARIALAAVCSLLIALALTSVRRGGGSGVAVLLALFPGTVFFSSTMSPSGLEITGAIALWCGLLFVEENGRNRIGWWSVLLGGLAVIGTRPIGFFVYLLVIGIALVATEGARKRWMAFGGPFVVHGLAIVGMVAWYFTVYDAQSSDSLVDGEAAMALTRQVTHGIESVPRMVDEAFGNFGWLDTPMPRLALYLLVGLVASGMSFGMRGAHRRAVTAVVMGLGAVAAVTVVIDVNYYSLFRLFGVQGRHVAPIMAGTILIACANLGRDVVRDRVLALSWAFVTAWAGLGALRRYAVGIRPDNAFDMFTNPRWAPVLGLWPSVMLLTVTPVVVAMVVMAKRGEEQ